MSAGLAAQAVTAGYAGRPVLHGVEVAVEPGQVVAVLGPNGAGKTTLARCLSGLLPCTEGDVVFGGRSIGGLSTAKRAHLGLALVPEERALFAGLSVADNLALGSFKRGRDEAPATRDEVLALFPSLADRLDQRAGTLSGGEQQMVAIGRALMSRPEVLVLDEPSLGLAPKVTGQILHTVAGLARDGVAVLMIEQNARLALEVSDRAVVMDRGRVVREDSAADMAGDPQVARSYLGGVA